MDISWGLFTVLIVIAIIAGVFLLIRFILIWYYKIDTRVDNQEIIIKQNKRIITLLEEINDNIQSGFLKQIENEK